MTHRRLHSSLFGSLVLTAFALNGGCSSSAEDTPAAGAIAAPHLLALSTYSASLGTPIDAYFANPPPSTARKIELVFDGTFTRPDGKTEAITTTQSMDRTEAGAARWTSFGPFQNPFAPTNPEIGVFKGKAGIKVTNADGTTTTDEAPLPVQFEVKPSIIITELQPTTAECAKPALRLIGSMTYKMKATTIGFKASSIEYTFRTPGVVPDLAGQPALDVSADGKAQYRTTKISHTMKGEVDKVDGKEALVLPPVPLDRPTYGVVFAVVARDQTGRSVGTSFGMTAHSPLEVYNDGRYQLAEVFPAKPLSGCTPGGQQGREVEYKESQTETKQRTISMTISSKWLKSEENNWSTSDGKTLTKSKTVTDGYSRTHGVTNTFSFEQSHSDTTGTSFNWQDTNANTNSSGWTDGKKGTAKLSVGMSKLFGGEIGGELSKDKRYDRGSTNTHGSGGENSSSSTNGWSSGQSQATLDQSTLDHSTATTDETAVTKTNTKGGAERNEVGGQKETKEEWTVSSSQTTERGFKGNIIAGTYGVFYRQMARYKQRAFVLVYNKCGEGDVIGDVTLDDYVWAPDLALGAACSPLPKSNFPEAQCYLAPCGR